MGCFNAKAQRRRGARTRNFKRTRLRKVGSFKKLKGLPDWFDSPKGWNVGLPVRLFDDHGNAEGQDVDAIIVIQPPIASVPALIFRGAEE